MTWISVTFHFSLLQSPNFRQTNPNGLPGPHDPCSPAGHALGRLWLAKLAKYEAEDIAEAKIRMKNKNIVPQAALKNIASAGGQIASTLSSSSSLSQSSSSSQNKPLLSKLYNALVGSWSSSSSSESSTSALSTGSNSQSASSQLSPLSSAARDHGDVTESKDNNHAHLQYMCPPCHPRYMQRQWGQATEVMKLPHRMQQGSSSTVAESSYCAQADGIFHFQVLECVVPFGRDPMTVFDEVYWRNPFYATFVPHQSSPTDTFSLWNSSLQRNLPSSTFYSSSSVSSSSTSTTSISSSSASWAPSNPAPPLNAPSLYAYTINSRDYCDQSPRILRMCVCVCLCVYYLSPHTLSLSHPFLFSISLTHTNPQNKATIVRTILQQRDEDRPQQSNIQDGLGCIL